MRLAILFLACVMGLGGCGLFPSGLQWKEHVFEDITYDDVFSTVYHQIDKRYQIQKSNRIEGTIKTFWDYDSVSSVTRLLQRERVIAEVFAVEAGTELKVRVETQVKERTGLLASDTRSDEDWSEGRDDDLRAELILARVRSILTKGRPSSEFYTRKPVLDDDSSADDR